MTMMTILRNLVFYAVFYVGSVFYVSLAALVARLFPRHARGMPEGWSAFHRWCVVHLLGIRVVIEGAPSSEPVLYALKHESFFEAIDLPTLLPHPAMFGKVELFAIPGWGRAAAAYGAIPVARDQGAKALRTMMALARERVQSGRPLAIFPEGTRVPHGTQPELKSGFMGIYKLIGLPIVPVAVCSGPVYHRRWKQAGGTIRIRFGEPVPPGLDRDEAEARVRAAINALNG